MSPGGLEAANLGYSHLASPHTEILLDQSSRRATHACHSNDIFPCNKESQEYERLLGMFLQSKGSSPWEVACSWLKSDQVENIVALFWKLKK